LLIDPGAGTSARDAGQLRCRLALADTSADEVDLVLLTHAHLGHAGGAVDALTRRPAYKGAQYVLSTDEWEFWMARPDLRSRRLQQMADRIHRHLDTLGDQVTLLRGGDEIVPGVRAIAAPGHSPGHQAISIMSEGIEVLCLSDAVLAPIHLQHPDWYARYDLRPEQAMTSRLRLLDRAAASGALVHAFHFPFPSLGWVRQTGPAWRWEPATHEGDARVLSVARPLEE
jgi:glyoxylase-like metal-dependent hydrolase (beta-lactamase superfamily II)